MKLLPGEREVVRTNGGILVLTTHRVRLDQQEAGRSQIVSIMLDQVASCGLITKSYPLLLLFAITVALLALWMRQIGAAVVGGGFFVALYWFSRRAILSVASSGAAIEIGATGLSREALVDFIDSVETAKLAFTRPTVASGT